jgi:hypothetical protein
VARLLGALGSADLHGHASCFAAAGVPAAAAAADAGKAADALASLALGTQAGMCYVLLYFAPEVCSLAWQKIVESERSSKVVRGDARPRPTTESDAHQKPSGVMRAYDRCSAVPARRGCCRHSSAGTSRRPSCCRGASSISPAPQAAGGGPGGSEKDAKLVQKLGQLQPFAAVFP